MVNAIARHAWTFAGSGLFSFRLGETLELRLAGGPVASLITADAPVCHYYAATFAGVFAAILGDKVKVTETACTASGAEACVFILRWR
jgi:divinyl protochlorophyllide a 8-vinyl-reductase